MCLQWKSRGCLALGFCFLFCFVLVLCCLHVMLILSRKVYSWQESKLPKLLATDVSCTSSSPDPLRFSQFRKLNCPVFISKNWPHGQIFLQIFILSSNICHCIVNFLGHGQLIDAEMRMFYKVLEIVLNINCFVK